MTFLEAGRTVVKTQTELLPRLAKLTGLRPVVPSLTEPDDTRPACEGGANNFVFRDHSRKQSR